MDTQKNITFNLNGVETSVLVDPLMRLIDVLRDTLKLTGTKEGCAEGECGACVILMEELLYNSCLLPVEAVENRHVMTIEGFRETKQFDVLKFAFELEGSVQCGFCTPGMIMAAHALLIQNPHPTKDEIQRFMSGNLCRCTGYDMITRAILKASEEGDGLW